MKTRSLRRWRTGSPGAATGPRSAPRKVLFFTAATRPPLGADVWVLAQVIRALDRREHDVHVWLSAGTKQRPTPIYETLRPVPGITVHAFDLGLRGSDRRARAAAAWRAVRSLLQLVRFVRRNDVSVVHVADRRVDAVVGVLVASVTGARSVIHSNVAYAPWMSRSLRWALRRADAVIAVSDFVATTLVDGGHRPDRVHVARNAIDPAGWTPGHERASTRAALGVHADSLVVLSVCRLFEAKGAADLIRACAAVRSQFPGLTLVIAGVEGVPGGTYRHTLESLIADLDMGASVVLAGWRDDIPRLMAAADVYAMPSDREPFGLVFLEAMTMRLPVVALDNGGTPEVVDHGETGLLSARGDLDGLIANLSKLLSDPDLRRVMGDAGRRRALDRFTESRLARDVAGVYDHLARTSS